MAQLTPEQLFDSIAITVDGPRAWDLDLALDVTLTDVGTTHHLTLRHGVLIHVPRSAGGATPTHVTLTKGRLLALLAGDLDSPGIQTTGDPTVLLSLLDALDGVDPSFDIVTP
ncbi:alkyl sulfatase C-terminal domain-containing protein [Ornithinimicrobium sediminis]|uniref:alkyl sulfatase C-terminal domain-containing protein n=1 Tax=Ornithinimicrobium sediminis TaxID=2904603 RepID=UPI001E5E043B|nr:alkyl sulfatase C-terminal domain-containing protein [Ornithinimicrobium sediminis]MCE0487257.1 hypothetical protein [Ornithinimicrobium sediminis]